MMKHRDFIEGILVGVTAILTIVMFAFASGHIHVYNDRLVCVW